MIKKGICLVCVIASLTLGACASKVKEIEYASPPSEKHEAQQIAYQKWLRQKEVVKKQQERDLLAQQEETRKSTELSLKTHKTQLRKKIDHFTSAIESGDCYTAEREAHKIMQNFNSVNRELEADLLTATCLCNLKEEGDIDRFTTCSEKLATVTKNRQYLDRESQLVLELRPYFKNNSSPSRDTRIDSLISNGLANTLKPNK